MKRFPLAFAICVLACANTAWASEATLDGTLRDVSGMPIGVGAPQYGARRAVFAALTQKF